MKVTSFECLSPTAGSFSAWIDVVREQIVDLHFMKDSDAPFRGALKFFDLLDTRITRIGADRHRVTRDCQRTRGADHDFVLLSLLHSGRVSIVQDGRTATLEPGDIAIYDVSRDYQFIGEETFDQFCLRIRRSEIEARVPDLSRVTACKLAGGKGITRLIAGYIQGIIEEADDLHPADARVLQAGLLDMIGASLADATAEPASRGGEYQYLLRKRILGHVEDRLFDEDLTCRSIAAHFSVSERYLRKLFACSGYSLSEHIWQRRLEEARRRLTVQRAHRRSVTSVAYECGFKDAGHFSRAFRTRFGLSPSEFSKRAV